MSQGDPMPRELALRVAEAFVASIEPVCERVAIAGSLRREKPTVRDIEVVAVPRFLDRPADDIWASPTRADLLEELLYEQIDRRAIELRLVEKHRADGTVDRQTMYGPAFKALLVAGIPCDLFVVRPPATWGVIFALRTGPGDWNTKLVMDCKAINRRVEGGQVIYWGQPVPTPEEEDFFAALGQPWVEPRDRHVDRVSIQRAIATVPA